MTNYEELYNEIKEMDRELAPGSETTAWGYFLDAMRQLGIEDVHCGNITDQTVPDEDAEWWRDAYQRMQNGQPFDDA